MNSFKHFYLTIFPLIVCFVNRGFAGHLSARTAKSNLEFKKIKDCEDLIYDAFYDDDIRKQLVKVFTSATIEDLKFEFREIIKLQRGPDRFLLRRVPDRNYLIDYVKAIFNDLIIDYQNIRDPVLYCKEEFPLYNLSCLETLKLLGLPSFENSIAGKKENLEYLYLQWNSTEINEINLFRTTYKKRASGKVGCVNYPNTATTLFFYNIVYAQAFFLYNVVLMMRLDIVDIKNVRKPKKFCFDLLSQEAKERRRREKLNQMLSELPLYKQGLLSWH